MTGSASSSRESSVVLFVRGAPKANGGFASAQRFVRDLTGVAAEFLPGITVLTFVVMVVVWALAFGAQSSH